jgi:hypothetical protein
VSQFLSARPEVIDDHSHRYDRSPTQNHLIDAISISRKWSIHNLYGYAFDHFRRQFLGRRIHPAVVLGVARRFGIPDLIEPAVKLLARPDISLSSWSTNPDIICHTTVVEVGVIGRMKEKILLARFALCAVPPIVHSATCCDKNRMTCSAAWRDFWMSIVVPRLLNLDGEVENLLWHIRTEHIAKADVPGMGDRCSEWTINDVVVNTGWRAELKIPEGAVNVLMVAEHLMLEPRAEDNVMS